MKRLGSFALNLSLLAAVLSLAGCERMMHDMYDQPRGRPYRSNDMFADGAGARTAPAGTVVHARGAGPGSSSGRLGAKEAQRRTRDEMALAQPYPVDETFLAHGRDRFNIYCMPCHSPIGDGDGRVVRRGFPAPPSYHSDRLRGVSDRYIFDVITRGYGVMTSYADRVPPADRWAIVAYVRALQLSQHARLDRLPHGEAERAQRALAATADREAHDPSTNPTHSHGAATGSAPINEKERP
ncbi:MAG TPA: cytochrome c [Burkholderiaceae bacterium]|nr:cytochrome c [Burkholderiaceae bacterium]